MLKTLMTTRTRSLISVLLFGLPALAATAPVPGIGNFEQVNAKLFRGAQPTNEGFLYLSKLGVKVVLDLREHDKRSVQEERAVTAAGMKYVNVPMSGLTPPTKAEINTVLTLLEDETAGPTFVHCKRGADRTGAVIAAYRIEHDKWDNAHALSEAMANGMSSFQIPRQHYIRNFQARNTVPAGAVATDAANGTAANGAAANGTAASAGASSVKNN
jgi:protein tyrosine/serine phosphatase